jgi:hypothetical protein
MNGVIHFVLPFNAFIGFLGTILFLFLIGGLGVLSGLFRRNEHIVTRVAMFLVGGFLLAVGIVMSVFLFQEYISAAITPISAYLK